MKLPCFSAAFWNKWNHFPRLKRLPLVGAARRGERKRKTVLELIGAIVGALWERVWTVLALSLVLMIIYMDLRQDRIDIEPFSVPETLQKSGFDGKVFAGRLADKLNERARGSIVGVA